MTESELVKDILEKDMSKIISVEDIPWPKRYSDKDKYYFLSDLKDCYEHIENYDMCNYISNLIVKLGFDEEEDF
jgi:hypothetical protein